MYQDMMSGYNAFHSGVKFVDCPHREGSSKWMGWTTGWLKAEELSKK